MCMTVATDLIPADELKEINDGLRKEGYPNSIMDDVFPKCKEKEWTKTRCVDTFKSLHNKKFEFFKKRHDAIDARSKKLDQKLGY